MTVEKDRSMTGGWPDKPLGAHVLDATEDKLVSQLGVRVTMDGGAENPYLIQRMQRNEDGTWGVSGQKPATVLEHKLWETTVTAMRALEAQ